MATSGIIYGSTAKTAVQIQLVWTITNQGRDSSGLGYSVVRFQPQYKISSTGYTTNFTNRTGYFYIGDETITKTTSLNVSGYKTDTWYNLGGYVDQTITHNPDGTMSIPVKYSISTGTSWSTAAAPSSGTSTIELETIPMASSATLSSTNLRITSGTSATLTVTVNPASSTFSHTVSGKIGTKTLTAVNLNPGQTTAAFTINASDISGSSASGSITVATKSGSTTIGTSGPYTFSVSVGIGPSIADSDVTVTTIALPTTSGVSITAGNWIAGVSKIQFHATVNAASGSTINKVEFFQNGSLMKTLEAPNSGTRYLWTSSTLESASEFAFEIRATDSRGNIGSYFKTITPSAYQKTSITGIKIFRCDSQGNADNKGTYMYIKATATVGNTSISNNRLSSLKCWYKRSSSSTYSSSITLTSGAQHIGSGWDSTVQYDFMFEAVDLFNVSAKTYKNIGTESRLIDARIQNKGIAFGKVAESDDLLDSAWRIQAPDARLALGLISAPVVANGSSTRLIVPQYMSFTNLGVESGQYTEYFEALLKWLCYTYQGRTHCIFVGVAYPGTRGLYAIEVYETGTHASLEETTLPTTSSGFFQRAGSANHEMYFWGTVSGVFYYNDVYSNTGSKTKNYVLAAPSSANGTPAFRKLVSNDLPTIGKDKLPEIATDDLPSESASSSIFTSFSSGSPSKQEARISGHFCNIYLEMTSGTVNAHSTITIQVADKYKPAIGGSGCAYYGIGSTSATTVMIAFIDSTGALTIRNTSGTNRTFSAANPLRLALSYYI